MSARPRGERRLAEFENHRAAMLGLAYQMLGDVGRAEDMVQDAWLRFQRVDGEVDAPRAFLTKTVARLCLNELDSARARREQARGDRLPEPIDLRSRGLASLELLDRVSMAFLVLLQRLTSAERAALLLHDVFDFDHKEVAEILGRSDAACRQLLKRARASLSEGRRSIVVSREEHARMLDAFLRACSAGDRQELMNILADDVVMVADAGSKGGTFGRVRNLSGPLVGARRVSAFLAAATPQGAADLATQTCELNGQPSALVLRGQGVAAVIQLAIADGRVQGIFMQADPERLARIIHQVASGSRRSVSDPS
ncbi:MAG: sigma-70 family RNA polymerase sigma factor [Myxococcales bacterium]|nr:sigma-70 family RNA polymerase sigma factor [Myxococcales bacterium]MDD9964986.1 sigma-70 family RNA polymerase sigma factor [Myxococcales bacterium]